MHRKIEYVKNNLNSNSLAIKFNENRLSQYIDKMYLDLYDNNKGDKYLKNAISVYSDNILPLVIVDPIDLNKLMLNDIDLYNKKVESIFNYTITDLKINPLLGKINHDSNIEYYVYFESDSIQEVRKALGLNPKELYITIGFNNTTVKNVNREDHLIKPKTKFQRMVTHNLNEYDDTWLWIFDIRNFPDVLKKHSDDINIIKVTEESIKCEIDDKHLEIRLIDNGNGDEFWICSLF